MKYSKLFLITFFIFVVIFPANSLPFGVPVYASTNANLFVSAENSQFNNYFAGPQVIQVVVSDPDIQRLDQAYGEPTVTVNGKKLRMAQATDGNWYAYFADRDQAIAADKTSGAAGRGLDFGQFCSSSSAVSPSFSETKGFAVARAVSGSVDKPLNSTLPACTNLTPTGALLNHVVRENKTLNGNAATSRFGQIGFPDSNVWPIIQLYDFGGSNPGTVQSVQVDYQKAGGDQISTLTFSRIPSNLITSSVDRTAYPANSQVFVTVNDPQLNIDPTEEDSWTWGANATNSTLYYMAFDRNGAADAENKAGAMQNLIGNLTTFMFNHNGKLTVNPAATGVNVLDFQQNDIQSLNSATVNHRGTTSQVFMGSIAKNSAPVTLIESGGVNTGTFASWSGYKKSDLITTNALSIRGQSATIRYNDVSTSIVGNFGYGTLSVSATNGTWASGQRIPITLVDADANLNTKLTEYRNLFDPSIYNFGTGGIPTMSIGTPFSLSNTGIADRISFVVQNISNMQKGMGTLNVTSLKSNSTVVQADSINVEHIDLVKPTKTTFTTNGILIDSGKTMNDLLNTIHSTLRNDTSNFKGYNFINYDLESVLTNASAPFGNMGIYLVYNTAGAGRIIAASGQPLTTLNVVSLANTTYPHGFINLNETQSGVVANGTQDTVNLFHHISKSSNIGLLFTFSNTIVFDNEVKPVAADFFSIGLVGDGTTNDQRINNAIYRWELVETGDNTSTFTGTTEFTMLNQLNIFNPNTYSALRTINHEVKFVAIGNMLQSENNTAQVKYSDLDGLGLNTMVSAQQDIITHTGVVSFDSNAYKIGNTVTITLNDTDLNVDNDLVDLYTVVTPLGNASNLQDVSTDTVGSRGLGTYSNGLPFGMLLDVEFGKQHIRWSNSNIKGQNYNNSPCFPVESGDGTAGGFSTSLSATGFSLVETGPSTGVFTGSFEVPDQLCQDKTIISSEGQNMEVKYVDFRDSSSNIATLSSNATIVTDPQNEQYDILFKSGHFIPSSTTSLVSDIALVKDNLQPNDVVHFLIQFTNIPDTSEISQFVPKGISIIGYVTGNTYMASSKVINLDYLSTVSNIRWIGTYNPQYKISSLLNPVIIKNIPDWAIHRNSTKLILTIQLQKDANLSDVENRTNLLGGTIVGVVPLVPDISADFDLAKINDTINSIAKIDDVAFVDIVDPPLEAVNDQARDASGVSLARTTFSGLNGTGVKVLVFDEGYVDGFNEDFAGRVSEPSSVQPTDMSSHSTHVAGTLGGSGKFPTDPGITSGKFAGMAPNVQIVSAVNQDEMLPSDDHSTTGDSLFTSVTNAMDIDKINITSMSLAAKLVPNHFDQRGLYSATSVLIDDLVMGGHRNIPMIFFEAAGNNRKCSCTFDYDTISPPAAAKNSIAVGAINTIPNEPMTDYSSFGPTADGRLKPDIVAPGSHDNNTGLMSDEAVRTSGVGVLHTATYFGDSGTSQATPVASGVAALLIQKWHAVHNLVPTPDPLPSTIKAIMIHTATDIGRPGPDYQFGWGALNATAAIKLVGDNGASDNLIHQGIIGNTVLGVPQNDSYTINNDNTGKFAIKATLVWDDKLPATLAVNPTLVNDLGLTLVSPTGHKFLPFVLDPSNPTKNAFRGTDHLNNVEMDIGNVEAGDWTVRVNNTKITLAMQQYSIVITKVPHIPDTTPPVVITSPNLTANTSNLAGMVVNYDSPTATDDVGVTSGPTCNPPSGSTFPVGTTTVTCTASDAAGNVGTATFTVTVSLTASNLFHVTVIKNVHKGVFGANLPPSSFPLSISNSTRTFTVTNGVPIMLSAGHYTVSEVSSGGFTGTFSGDCDSSGVINLDHDGEICNVDNNHCLIATAAFGSELAPEVQFLRSFRDNDIRTTSVGSDFMTVFNQWYYSFSPDVANYETQNPVFREVIKDSLYPLLGILVVSEKAFFLIGGNYGTMTAGLIAVSLMGVVYISPLTLSIKSVRNGKIHLRFAAYIVMGIAASVMGAILLDNQIVLMLTSLLFLLSLIAITSLVTGKMISTIGKRVIRKFHNK